MADEPPRTHCPHGIEIGSFGVCARCVWNEWDAKKEKTFRRMPIRDIQELSDIACFWRAVSGESNPEGGFSGTANLLRRHGERIQEILGEDKE